MSGPARYDASGRLLDPWYMLREAEAGRDRLASDLQATRAELERVRIAYLRQIERRASKHVTEWMGVIRSMGCWDHRSYQGRRLIRITKVRDACRAALATMETGRS